MSNYRRSHKGVSRILTLESFSLFMFCKMNVDTNVKIAIILLTFRRTNVDAFDLVHFHNEHI